MSFAGKVWRLLVGIKDALALIFLLLFFITLFALLSARPNPGIVRDGALLLELDGSVVEESSAPDPLDVLLSGQVPARQFPVRDLVRAIDGAVADDRIKALVLDLTNFQGGGQVHMQALGEAIDRLRATNKPVLTYGLSYTDDSLMLAAHASEVWVHPMGSAIVQGPGGERIYYAGLLDKLNINARVFRVGKYKSAVEPYLRGDMSPEARENAQAFYGSLWEEWQANVKKARPAANIELVTSDIEGWLAASNGDPARAALAAGLVDKLGDQAEFGARVAKIVGEDSWDSAPGAYAHTEFGPWLASLKSENSGKAIGVITVAGEIVDGDDGPGVAGGARIARILDDALDEDFAALVIRVDSPGGTIYGSEQIRRAILRHKAKGIPVAVSMANVAASGGYWVSTPADRIFAEPETITGSIGVFGVVPTFESALADYGVTTDGVMTTPLSGQPDLMAGFTPEVETLLQKTVEFSYDQFLGLVAQNRGKTKAEIDAIGQGRVWDGGTARQIGLIDQFGNLDNALEWAAKQAKLKDGDWHAAYLGSVIDPYDALIRDLLMSSGPQENGAASPDPFAMVANHKRRLGQQMDHDLGLLLGSRGVQAHCLECPAAPASAYAPPAGGQGAMQQAGFLARLALLIGP